MWQGASVFKRTSSQRGKHSLKSSLTDNEQMMESIDAAYSSVLGSLNKTFRCCLLDSEYEGKVMVEE